MAAIQPISTLRDHEKVLKLPTPDKLRHKRLTDIIEQEQSDPDELDKAKQNMTDAMRSRRVSIDDMLMDQPERPERDNEAIGKSRNLAKKAALIQVLDAIGDTMHLNRKQEEATIVPTRMADLGFTAFERIRDLDDEYRIDLKNFQNRRDQVNEYNRAATREATQHNADIDYNIEKMKLDELETERDQNYQAALRYISSGNHEAAARHLERAGLIAPLADQPSTPVEDRNERGRSASENTTGRTERSSSGRRDDEGSDESSVVRFSELPPDEQEKVQRSARTLQNVLENNLYTAADPENREKTLSMWRKISREQLQGHGIPVEKADIMSQEILSNRLYEQIFATTNPNKQHNIVSSWIKTTTDLLKERGLPVEGADDGEKTFGERIAEHFAGPEAPEYRKLSDKEVEQELRRRFRELIKRQVLETNPVDMKPALMRQLHELALLRNDGKQIPNVMPGSTFPFRKIEQFGIDRIEPGSFADEFHRRFQYAPAGVVRAQRGNYEVVDENGRTMDVGEPNEYFKRLMEPENIDLLFDRWSKGAFTEDRSGLGPVSRERPDENADLQKRLVLDIMQAEDQQTREQAAGEWLRRNTQMLQAEGVPEDQIDELNEGMFARMVLDLGGGEQQPFPDGATKGRIPAEPLPAYLERLETFLKKIEEGMQSAPDSTGRNEDLQKELQNIRMELQDIKNPGL